MLVGRRILVDASMVTSGGGYTFLVNMVPLLAAAAPEAKFLILLRTASLASAIAPRANLEIRALPATGLLGRVLFLAFRAAGVARRWKADLYLSAADYAPRGAPCPVVVYLRNANIFTPLDLGWGRYQRGRLWLLRRLAMRSANSADRVLFVSHDSASWMGDAANVGEERRAVIHHGVDVEDWRKNLSQGPIRGSAGILSLSSIYRYKNCVRLVEAYCELARRIPNLPPLTIVGDDQDSRYSRELRQARENSGALAKQIHLVGAVPYEEVLSYYRDAVLFVFPSYLETFGHPLLEAMAADLPVVAADIPVFREIAGDAALYVDPFDVEAIADGMERVLSDPDLGAGLVESARQRANDFTWKIAARRLGALLDEVIREA
jgi:glycosyltransferase involved in cell wall biosynthesis